MPAPKNTPTYSELNTQLEQLLADLQAPDIQIDEAVALYEQGLHLVTQLEKHVATAENTITKLKLQVEAS